MQKLVLTLAGLVLALALGSGQAAADHRGRTAAAAAPITAVCGNGRTEAPEECDDGNVVADDNCSPTCKIEIVVPIAPCCTEVETLEAGEVTTPVLKAEKLEVTGPATFGPTTVHTATIGQATVDKMEVKALTLPQGADPIHSFALLGSFGTGFSDAGPYTLFGKARYSVQFGLIGVSVKAGAGTIGAYDGDKVTAVSIEGAALIGNSRGGAEIGFELMPSGPFPGGEQWENTGSLKLGGYLRAPEGEENSFILLPWVKYVTYEPKSPGFPAYNPLVLIGIEGGWEHLWLPKKPKP